MLSGSSPPARASSAAAWRPDEGETRSSERSRICSLGTVHIRGSEPEAAPVIQPNYLGTATATAGDRAVAIDALRLVRRIVSAPALRKYRLQEYKPGAHLTGDDELARAAADVGTTIFHPVGTAKMGSDRDPIAVTDERLRLRGLDGLRIADASIMRTINSGAANAPTLMIAEKGATMIRKDRNRSG